MKIFLQRIAVHAVGGTLTPPGYAILAVIVVAILLVAMLSTCWVPDELDGVLRVGCWFS